MPMQSQEDAEKDEQLENEELDPPTSPSTYDSNTQTQKPFASKLIDNNEECCLNVLYDNAVEDRKSVV